MPQLLCPILRPDSARAVPLAGDLASRLALELVLVDVRSVRPGPMFAPEAAGAPVVIPTAGVGDPVAEAAPAQPPVDLEALAHQAGVRPHRLEHVEAPPLQALRDLSSRPEVELLVVGDAGHGPLASALVGDAPRGALRDVHSPLVLVPVHTGQTALPPRPSVVCAVDDDDVAETVAVFAAAFAQRLGGALTLLHAGDDADRAARVRARCRRALVDLDDASFETVPGTAAEDLDALAAERGAHLIVVGRPRHGALLSSLRGSVAHSAAQGASLPVVVVPDAAGVHR